MSFKAYTLPIPNIDATGHSLLDGVQSSIPLGVTEVGRLVAIGIDVHDSALSANTEVKVESVLPSTLALASAPRKTIWDKVIGATGIPVENLSEAFYDASGNPRTTNYWYGAHIGDILVTVSAASAGVASTTGLTVVLIVEY